MKPSRIPRKPMRVARKSLAKGIKPRFKRVRRKKGEIPRLKAKLWDLCREITRKRYGNVCYTCGKSGLSGGNWQTGHYITSSLCSVSLRYDLRNLRPQCYHDNINLSGNWPEFYRRMEEEETGITQQLLAHNQETKGKVFQKEWYEQRIEAYSNILATEKAERSDGKDGGL